MEQPPASRPVRGPPRAAMCSRDSLHDGLAPEPVARSARAPSSARGGLVLE